MFLTPILTKQNLLNHKFRIACGIIIVTGLLALIGWQFNLALLKGTVVNSVPVNPLTAILFIFMGISAFLLSDENKYKQLEWLANVILVIVLLVAFVEFIKVFGTVDLGLSSFFFHNQVVAAGSQMSPVAAICFILASLALLAKDFQGQLIRNPSHFLLLASAFVLMLSFLGYLYGVSYYYEIAKSRFYPISIYSVYNFLLLDMVIMAIAPKGGFIELISDKGTAGVTMRRLIPIILFITIIIGWGRFYLQAAGIMNYELLVPLAFTIYFFIIVIVIWLNAKSLFSIEKQRIKAAEQVQHQRHLLQSVISSVGESIIVVDEDCKVMVLNKTASELFEINQNKMIGKDIHTYLACMHNDTPLSPKQSPANLVAKSGKMMEIHLQDNIYIKTSADKIIPIAGEIAPLKGHTDVKGLVMSFRDITKEKEIDMAKTEFVSLASHQLRTPLSTINWYGEMLINGDAGAINQNQVEYMGEIMRANKRMIGLVNSLLNVSRIELGAFSKVTQNVNPVEITHIVLEELKGSILEKKLIVDESYEEKGSLSIMADASYVKIIFQNLLSNAVKYTQIGGKIGVSLSKDQNDFLVLKVSDSGVGIPEDAKSQVFLKLFRADNVKVSNTEGTGLGLYLVKLIIDKSGGKIWFESKENKGSTFYVSLPSKPKQIKTGDTQIKNISKE